MSIAEVIFLTISLLSEHARSMKERALYAFLAVCSVSAALYIAARIISYRRSFRWPRARARVVFSKIETGDDDGFPFYEPFITYEYTVDQKEYTSGSIYLHSAGRWRDKVMADRFTARYREGESIDIYYNPSKPGMSFIERSAWGWLFWMVVFFLFLAIMSVFFTALSLGTIKI
jgi:hypothetical protein